jgi:hypothetical protein
VERVSTTWADPDPDPVADAEPDPIADAEPDPIADADPNAAAGAVAVHTSTAGIDRAREAPRRAERGQKTRRAEARVLPG